MAWKTELHIRGAGELATVLADYFDFIENVAGWTLYDNISATEKVFWTQGESGTLPKQYVRFYSASASIYAYAYVFWNASTHVGYGYNSVPSYYRAATSTAAGEYRYFGNKNTVGIFTPDASIYPLLIAGYFGADGDVGSFPEATLSAGASAGANVVLSVDNTTKFRLASTCIIVDHSTGMRDDVEIVGIIAGVSITVATLANNYTSGSIIGEAPLAFGHVADRNYPNRVYHTVGAVSGSGGVSLYISVSRMLPVYAPSLTNDLDAIPPRLVPGYRSVSRGYETYLRNHSRSRRDLFLVNDDMQFPINTASGGSTTYLDDTSKSWTINEFAGETVAIVAGTGINQSRVILSNTATRLTFRDAMIVAPVAGSNYVLAEKSYYCIANSHVAYLENED